jgi:hypothetical protein
MTWMTSSALTTNHVVTCGLPHYFRASWRGLWRRRRFPCVVWRQIRGELLGHLSLSSDHRARTDRGRSALRCR